MLNQNQWRSLQLFGGEGASGAPGGDGGGQTAAPGEESVDAGHRRLRELGVPESKLKKHTTAPASVLPEGAVRTQPEGRMTWEEIAIFGVLLVLVVCMAFRGLILHYNDKSQ